MKIISLGIDDTERIYSLYKDDFSDGWNENMLISAFNNGRFAVIGAEENNNLIGIISLSISVDDGDIEDIFVKEEYRKSGVGSALMESAINYFKSKSKNKIFLEVRENNENAIKLYKKFGFNVISTRKKYYSDGENALVMIKESVGK